jgi:hypothetical protein
MDDLTCVKEIIQALPSEKQKELFHQFIACLNSQSLQTTVGVRPTTPTTSHQTESLTFKRPLGSPESPKRSKKSIEVFYFYLWHLLIY